MSVRRKWMILVTMAQRVCGILFASMIFLVGHKINVAACTSPLGQAPR